MTSAFRAPTCNRSRGAYVRRMTIDPVCGMEIEEAQAPAKTEFEGRTYYFCSESCRDEFEANPQLYAPNVSAPSTTA